MPNTLVALYRERVPGDPRSDEELTRIFGQQNDADGRYNGFSDFVQEWGAMKAPAELPPETKEDIPIGAELGRGFRRGVAGLKSSAYGLGSLAADLAGADSLQQTLAEKYRETEEEAAQENAPGVARLEDIQSFSDAARYAMGKAGEAVPVVGEAILTGAAGAAAGSAVAGPAGTVGGGAAGIIEGLVARRAAKSAMNALIKGALKAELKDAERDLVVDQLGKIARRETVDALSDKTAGILTREIGAKARHYGATAANVVNFFGIGAGAVFPGLDANPNVTDEDARIGAAIAGLGGAGGILLPVAVTSKLFPGIGAEVANSYVKRLAVEAAKEIPIGAVGNALTEVGNIAAERYADPTKRDLPLTDEEVSRIYNASVVGGALGAVTAPVTAIPGGGKGKSKPDSVLEAQFPNVKEDRRTQIAQLKGRMAQAEEAGLTPNPEDIAAYRTLEGEERNYFTVAEPIATTGKGAPKPKEPEPISRSEQSDAQADETPEGQAPAAEPAVPPATQTGATSSPEPAKPVTLTPEQIEARRKAAQVVTDTDDDGAVAAARARVDAAAAKTKTTPTIAQTEAGNFAKGKVRVQGLEISVENPKGSKRVAKDGSWEVEMPGEYGYILGTKGKDKDHVDVTIGPNPKRDTVYVVDQIDPKTGKLDEHKTFLGFESQAQAEAAYDASFSDGSGPSRRGAVSAMPMDQFKAWLKDGDKTKGVKYEEPSSGERGGTLRTEPETQPEAATPVAAGMGEAKETKGGETKSETRIRKTDETRTEGRQEGRQERLLTEPEPKPKAEPIKEVPAGEVKAPAPEVLPPRSTKFEDVDIEKRATAVSSGRGRKGKEGALEPAWFRPKGDESMLRLSEVLLSDASPTDQKARNSLTHRITSMLDRVTGKVHNVSTFENNGETKVTKFADLKGKKAVALTDVLRAETPDGYKRFAVLGSSRIKEAREYVNDVFKDADSFEKEYGGPLDKMLATEKRNAADADTRMQQAREFDRAEETDDSPDKLLMQKEVGELNLEPEDVEALVSKMPKFNRDELADMIARKAVEPGLLKIIKRIAVEDPDFFEQAENLGTAEALKLYGYETNQADAGAGRPVEQRAPGRPADNLENNPVSGGQGDVRPTPAMAGGQDSLGRNRQAGARGNEVPVETGQEVAATVSANQPDIAEPIGNGMVRLTTPEGVREVDANHAAILGQIHDAVIRGGIDLKVVRGELSFGAYDAQNKAMLQIVNHVVGGTDVKTGLHEVGHHVFATEHPQMRDRLTRAVEALTDDELGNISDDPRIRDNRKLTGDVLQEERLVDATAEKLLREGFSPAEAQGYAKQFVRAVKDYYYRAAMTVQRMLGFKESPRLALDCFENRIKSFLAGDRETLPYQQWIGAVKPALSKRAAEWFGSREDFLPDGMVVCNGVADLSMAAARFNLDNAIRFTTPESRMAPERTRKVQVEKRAATINHALDTHALVGKVLMADPKLAEAIRASKQTPEAFFRTVVRVSDPAKMKLLLGNERETNGSPVVFDSDARLDSFKAESNRGEVLQDTYRGVQSLIGRTGTVLGQADKWVRRWTKALERKRQSYEEAKANYKDYQHQTTEAVRAMRKELNVLARKLRGKPGRESVVEQQLKAIDPSGKLEDYYPVFQSLLKQDAAEQVVDLIDQLANDPAVDFTKPVTELLSDMRGSATPYGEIASGSAKGNALLALVTGFAKTNQRAMVELEMRRIADGKKRIELERQAKDAKQEFSANIRELAKTAKIEERLRLAYAETSRELRAVDRRLNRVRTRIAAAEAAMPVLFREQARLAKELQIGADFTFGDGAMVTVPDSPTMSTADLVARDSKGQIKTAKRLTLDSTGKPTKPEELDGWIQKMAAFTAARESSARNGDESAMDSAYWGVRRQLRELIENKAGYKNVVGPAQRLMAELSVMPVGKMIADGIGTPVARSVDQMMNRFVNVLTKKRQDAERIGRVNDQLENVLLDMLPGVKGFGPFKTHAITRDQLRKGILNFAKAEWERQDDLAELYANQPDKLRRAVYQRIREELLRNKATAEYVRPVIDKFMPALENLLEHQWKADSEFLLAEVEEAGTGVLDPKLKVFNPATGQYESGVRRHVPTGPRTFARRLHTDTGIMVNAMDSSDWGRMKDVVQQVPEVFEKDGADGVRQLVAGMFDHPEHGDQVQNAFMLPLVEMESAPAFKAPAMKDGVTKPPADPMLVREAFDDAHGDVVTFAERMFELHGGEGDKGAYIQDVLGTLDTYYTEIRRLHNDYSPGGSHEGMKGVRNMVAGALIDARQVDHLPGQWFDYHSYDQRDMYRMVERIAAQTAFGRGQERLGLAFDTLSKEVRQAQYKLGQAQQEVKNANPLATTKEVEAAMIKKFGKKEYDVLTKQVQRATLLRKASNELSAYFRRDNSPDASLRAAVRVAQLLGNMLVNQPSSALYQMSALFDINTKYGASGSTARATLSTLKSVGQELAGSFAQAVGMEMKGGGEYKDLYLRLGLGDGAVVKRFRDTFDRFEGESRVTHVFRGINEALGVGLNRRGEKARNTILRPLQPFVTSAIATNRALTEGMWKLAGNHVMKGMEYFAANRGKLDDPSFQLTADLLGLKGAERDGFNRLTADMTRWGLDYSDMVRGAIQRKAKGDRSLFTDAQAMLLHSMAMAEVSSESSLSTMPLAAYNSSLIRFIAPLLGWSFRRAQTVAGMRLDPEGRQTFAAFGRGMAGLSVAAMGGLGVSMLVDQYYEEVLGKQRNLRPIIGAPDGKELALGILENLNRIGTTGLFGELANGVMNVGQGADNRVISVDQRVVALSALNAVQQAVSSFIHQGFEADYVHVVRPLTTAFGGNGLLQYMQLANRAFGLDNAEARVNARINAQNYLRVVGRQLDLDVRPSSRGGYNAPTPVTPALTRMELAAYANDAAAFEKARREAVMAAKEDGHADPVDYVKRAYTARNPLRTVFRTPPSQREYNRILTTLPDDGRRDVSEAIDLFNTFSERIGGRAYEGSKDQEVNPMDLRRQAATAIYP